MIRFVAVLMFALLPGVAVAGPVHQQLVRPDGSSIEYTLDAPDGDTAGLVVLLTGSGCLPGAVNTNIGMARAAFGNYTALIVEKFGVAPDAAIADGFTDCPAAFHEGHTVSQRVADTVAVIIHLGDMGPLVLFGGSEGGLTAAVLATRVEADGVVMLSSGPGLPFDELVLSTVPPEGQEQVSAGLAAARADPQGLAMFAGSSHRFWADIQSYRAEDYVARTQTPFLLIQGGMDTSSPVAAARMTVDRFNAEGRCNLTYWEFAGLDHGMADANGVSRMARVLGLAADWADGVDLGC